MGLIASSPCCHPRMAPVIWGLHLAADHAVTYRADRLITSAFMMRKIALKIQRAEPSSGDRESAEEKRKIRRLPTCQKIIIVPS